jgi:hypothetical protein
MNPAEKLISGFQDLENIAVASTARHPYAQRSFQTKSS